ncbi:MAG: biotin synthase BioB [Gammaproteobacteria bacterium]|nr:biotin synthase BioB [Gammaproteobacteria bacterium]
MNNIRHNWSVDEVNALFELPLMDLLYQAQTAHRTHFEPNTVQLSILLNIKTGGCPENCSYCPQSAHYNTGLKREKLMTTDQVIEKAQLAKEKGASRFCMGAAWRSPSDKDLPKVIEMVKAVKALGLETCVTLGMLSDRQAQALKEGGLDYYNHNLDTSPEFYPNIITTRTYQERLDTLDAVRKADIHVCCGGILGMGEARLDRISLLLQLANLPAHPKSVPINALIAVEGTPLEAQKTIEPFEFIRTIAVARILMPQSMVRLSAGRLSMSDEMQALCFFAGANSIFVDDVLLTRSNPSLNKDTALLASLGMRAMTEAECTQ